LNVAEYFSEKVPENVFESMRPKMCPKMCPKMRPKMRPKVARKLFFDFGPKIFENFGGAIIEKSFRQHWGTFSGTFLGTRFPVRCWARFEHVCGHV